MGFSFDKNNSNCFSVRLSQILVCCTPTSLHRHSCAPDRQDREAKISWTRAECGHAASLSLPTASIRCSLAPLQLVYWSLSLKPSEVHNGAMEEGIWA